jgi:D-lactate dehydrogenase
MRLAVFSTKPNDRQFLSSVNEREARRHELVFFEARLEEATASLGQGLPAVCAFVNDDLGARVLASLAEHDTRLIALRSTGFNNVDLSAAGGLGMTAAMLRLPTYPPAAAGVAHAPDDGQSEGIGGR